jgi:hypothetical protein
MHAPSVHVPAANRHKPGSGARFDASRSPLCQDDGANASAAERLAQGASRSHISAIRMLKFRSGRVACIKDLELMSRMTPFASPLLLGFDAMEKTLERISKASDGYPPYNIERLPPIASPTIPSACASRLPLPALRKRNWTSRSRKTSWSSAVARRIRASASISIAASPHGSSSAPSFSPMACRFLAPG